MIPFSIMNK